MKDKRSPAFRFGYLVGTITTALLIIDGLVRLAAWLL